MFVSFMILLRPILIPNYPRCSRDPVNPSDSLTRPARMANRTSNEAKMAAILSHVLPSKTFRPELRLFLRRQQKDTSVSTESPTESGLLYPRSGLTAPRY